MKRLNYLEKTNAYRRLATLIFLFAHVLIYAQPGDMPPNARPGECYAKGLMAPTYDSSLTTISVYRGTDSTILSEYTVDTILTLKPESVKWVRKKVERNCFSDDPRDCLVWSLEPAKAKTLRIQRYLLDTTVTSEYISQNRYGYSIVEPGGYTEWKTIVCRNKVTPKFIQRLRNALGMKEDKSVKTMDADTKAALVKYQREHGLPVGQLDKESIKHLGVKWPR